MTTLLTMIFMLPPRPLQYLVFEWKASLRTPDEFGRLPAHNFLINLAPSLGESYPYSYPTSTPRLTSFLTLIRYPHPRGAC